MNASNKTVPTPAYACEKYSIGDKSCTRWCGDCAATKEMESARDTHEWQYKDGGVCGKCYALKGTRRGDLPCEAIQAAAITSESATEVKGAQQGASEAEQLARLLEGDPSFATLSRAANMLRDLAARIKGDAA